MPTLIKVPPSLTERIAAPEVGGTAPGDIAILITDLEAGRQQANCQFAAIEENQRLTEAALKDGQDPEKLTVNLDC